MLRPSLALGLSVVLALAARAQTPVLLDPVAVVPGVDVLHARIATGDLNGDGNADLVVSGLDRVTRQPRVALLRFTSATTTVVRGTTFYYANYSLVINQFAGAWGGDVLAHDLDGDGDDDLVYVGAADTTSSGTPSVVVTVQNAGTLREATLAGLPPLTHARLAASGPYLAAMGRLASGATTLVVLRRPQAGGLAHTTDATATGAELGTLAMGDCDADGDPDVVATGLNAAGRPVAWLLRNTGSGFAESALDIPGVFNGDALLRDLDGDGDADLVVTGSVYGPMGTEGATRVYRADGCAFTPVELAPDLAALEGTGLAVADVAGVGTELMVNGRVSNGGPVVAFVPLGSLTGPLAIRSREAGALHGDLVVYDYDRNGRADVLTIGVQEQSVNDLPALVPAVFLYRLPGTGN